MHARRAGVASGVAPLRARQTAYSSPGSAKQARSVDINAYERRVLTSCNECRNEMMEMTWLFSFI